MDFEINLRIPAEQSIMLDKFDGSLQEYIQ